jgi:putative nucleotide binding protein
MEETKEEKALIIDFLPHGYFDSRERQPIAQAVGLSHFTLLELVPKREVKLELKEEVYIGPAKRDKIYFIRGRLLKSRITETAKLQIQDFVEKTVAEKEKMFVDFLNGAQALSTRVHQLELLPGLGKKFTKAILEERAKKPFESFEDVKARVKSVSNIRKIIEKRLYEELTEEVRHKLFVA